jgi:hypothetical protein
VLLGKVNWKHCEKIVFMPSGTALGWWCIAQWWNSTCLARPWVPPPLPPKKEKKKFKSQQEVIIIINIIRSLEG